MNKLASPRRLLSIAIAGAFALLLATAGAQTYPTFTTTTPIDYGYGQPQKMVLADFDGDGKADMATLGYANGSESSPMYLEVFLGTGDGNFASSPTAFIQVNQCAAIRGLAAYGRDVDGSLNLAVLCYDTLQIWHVIHYAATPNRPIYLINDPSTRQVIPLDTGGVAMAVGDFTGIGSPGIAVLEYGADNHAHTVAVYMPPAPCSSCSGSSDFIQLITQPLMINISGAVGANEIGTAIAAVQIPPDNTAALAIATEVLGTCGGNLVSYFYGGSGSFEIGDIVPIPAPFCASAIAAGDLDNDGYTDVVVGGTTPATSQYHGSGFLMTFNGSSDAVFGSGTAPFTTSAPSPNDSGEMSIVDLNGDGNADLVVGGPQPNGISTRSATVHIYFGNGDLTFGNDVTPGVDVSGSNPSGLSKGVLAVSANNINADGSPELTTVDLIGDGSGGGVGDLAPKPGSFVQVFNDRTIATTTTIQAADSIGPGPGGGGGEVRGATAHSARVQPRFFGVGATTLQANVTPAEATGFVQFFDATTQAWIGSGALNDGIATLTVQVAGTHYYIASYYGSAPYQGSSSDAEQITPQKLSSYTSIDVEPSNPAPFTPVVLSAFVRGQSGTPTGTVTFVDDNTGNTLGSATLDGYGNATLTLSTLNVGDYEISASYPGDNTYKESFSDDEEVIVAVPLIPATISLSASPTTSQYGSPVLATANIASTGSATPSGNLLFQLDSVTVATVAIVNGTASATLTPPAGQHQVQVVYAGDGISTSAQSNVVQLIIHGGVLQFTPGAATTLAGVPATSNTGTYGGDGGPATSAHLHTPFGLASFDGSTYIADEENNVIRKVAGDGTITTVAGQQYVGSIYFTRFGGDGGVATNAYLDDPTSVVLDSVGNLYIADYNNNVIRRVDAVTGIITTYAGDAAHPGYNGDSGPATSMHLNNPLQITLDAAGNLYIADRGNNLVRKVDTNGNLTTVAGHYGYYSGPSYGGLAINSPLKQPNGVAVDSMGNLYIADTQDYVVVKVDTSGIVTKFAGGSASYQPMQGDGGPALNAQLNLPFQLAIDPANNLYIADSGNDVVRKVDTSSIITTVAGIQGASSSGRYDPNGTPATSAPLVAVEGIAIEPSGSLLVADTYNQTVWRVGPQGALVFGPQAAGATSDPQFVTLNNVGDSPITFSATPFTVTGDYVVSSEGTSPCSFSAGLAVGASCTLAVRYRPSTGALTGDVTFAGNASGTPVIHLVTNTNRLPSSVQLEVDSQTSQLGDTVLLFGQVAAAPNSALPTGSFNFYDGGTLLGSSAATSASGGAYGYIYATTLALGDHTITTTYSGDGNYAPSTSDPMIATITPILTAVTLTASATDITRGTSVSFTAQVTAQTAGTPLSAGTITFFDGTTALRTVTVDGTGTAAFTTSSLSVGTRPITAMYSAQGNYGSSTSPVVTVTVSGSGGGGGGGATGFDYVIQSLGVPAAIHRGDTARLALSVQPIGIYPGAVQLSCGTLPSYATCSFSNPRLIFNGGSQQDSQTVIWTITTTPAPAGAVQGASALIGGSGAHALPHVRIR